MINSPGSAHPLVEITDSRFATFMIDKMLLVCCMWHTSYEGAPQLHHFSRASIAETVAITLKNQLHTRIVQSQKTTCFPASMLSIGEPNP